MGLYEKIVEYYNNTPQEEIDRVWALSEDYNYPEFGGITVGEFMEQLDERQKELDHEFNKILEDKPVVKIDFSDPEVIKHFEEVKRLQQEILERRNFDPKFLNDIITI